MSWWAIDVRTPVDRREMLGAWPVGYVLGLGLAAALAAFKNLI